MKLAFTAVLVILIIVSLLALLLRREKSPQKTQNNTSGKCDNWQIQERWEDYPTANYNKIHTYCSVIFEDSGRTFFYRTRNPELKVGDLVYVPVGYSYEKKVGRIVKMNNYPGYLAPHPLEKTKYIIGKVEK